MAVRIYRDKDVDLRWLKNKTCVVIGFGAQGRAHALNLRDSGIDVIVALYRSSKSHRAARGHGFRVHETDAAVREAHVIFLAVPDTKMGAVFQADIRPQLQAGQALLFAHGFAIHYRVIVPPKDVDVVMVAPKGLGPMVRREFVRGRGAPGLVAVYREATGNAKRTALAWAKGIGCTRAGVIETTFREETETDLFGEQAVLCGGLTSLIRNGFETLVAAGYPAELAYFECLHELKFIVDLVHEQGIAGMRALVSDTAKWGDLTVGPTVINRDVRKRMVAALDHIRSGNFARDFVREMSSGGTRFARLSQEAEKHPIEQVGKRLRAMMAWKKKKK